MNIIDYTDSLGVLSGKIVQCDSGFVPALDRFCTYLSKNNLGFCITSSYRNTLNVAGAIVPPAHHGDHLKGRAIDGNFVINGVDWTSADLQKAVDSNTLPYGVTNFLQCIKDDKSLRWGGEFHDVDNVHFDDGFSAEITVPIVLIALVALFFIFFKF